ncbi:MAG: DUF1697 domain-containing protein [Thiotrichaceae bacterium]
MNTFIALFRGINVGGRNILPMKELRTILETLGCENIKTYIQSGNVLFQTDKGRAEVANDMSQGIKKSHGFEPRVLILDKGEFNKAIENNPFSTEDGKILHFFFLEQKPVNPDLDSIHKLKTQSELYEIKDKVFYLYAPDGIGRSKLVANVEKKLGVAATARNWNSVNKINAMLDAG